MGAYTVVKKDVLIIYRNEPLLFVHGPPVFIKIAITVEESTSIFVIDEGELEATLDVVGERLEVKEIVEARGQEEIQSIPLADPSIVKRIMYLGTPFPRQAYQPLQFVLSDETLTGKIEKIEGETLFIETNTGDNELVAIEMEKINEILWRGSPFMN